MLADDLGRISIRGSPFTGWRLRANEKRILKHRNFDRIERAGATIFRMPAEYTI
jgi:hypothetical protein